MDSVDFEQAVARRASQLRLMIVTPIGEFMVPPDIALRYRLVKQTAKGRPDCRTKEGRSLLAWEAEFLAEVVALELEKQWFESTYRKFTMEGTS